MKRALKIYEGILTFYMMVGAIPAVAIMNILDRETWKRGFLSPIIGIFACLLTLPLLPFLAVGVGAAYLGDRVHEGTDWDQF